jgi:hypothetical protein
LVGACGSSDAPKPAAAAPAMSPVHADALLLETPGGIEVWATFARESKDSTGASCIERAVEVRDGTTRRQVPLLYTRDIPQLVNDTTIRARLWTDCRPGDAYLVNLRNGLPVRKTK